MMNTALRSYPTCVCVSVYPQETLQVYKMLSLTSSEIVLGLLAWLECPAQRHQVWWDALLPPGSFARMSARSACGTDKLWILTIQTTIGRESLVYECRSPNCWIFIRVKKTCFGKFQTASARTDVSSCHHGARTSQSLLGGAVPFLSEHILNHRYLPIYGGL